MLVRIKVLGWSTGDGVEPETEGAWPERAELWLGRLLGIWTWRMGTKAGELLDNLQAILKYLTQTKKQI